MRWNFHTHLWLSNFQHLRQRRLNDPFNSHNNMLLKNLLHSATPRERNRSGIRLLRSKYSQGQWSPRGDNIPRENQWFQPRALQTLFSRHALLVCGVFVLFCAAFMCVHCNTSARSGEYYIHDSLFGSNVNISQFFAESLTLLLENTGYQASDVDNCYRSLLQVNEVCAF